MIVLGSINIDLIAKVTHLPIAGETLLGKELITVPGGKGANQAVAIARLGVPVQMVGRVGGDSFGLQLLDSLKTAGVQTQGIFIDNTVNSGIAIIAVDDNGENQIIVIPGANDRLNEIDIKTLENLLPNASALLLQLEIPLPIVLLAAKAAKKAGVKVILDPAPVREELPAEIYNLVDIITPNQIEAQQLTSITINNIETAALAAEILQKKGVETAIVKLGAQGAVCATSEKIFFIPAFPVTVIDTIAAGDAFNGGLAVALAEGLTLRQATTWAAAVAALCVTKTGAQSAMPDRTTFHTFLQQITPSIS